jgi:hypothetical protein
MEISEKEFKINEILGEGLSIDILLKEGKMHTIRVGRSGRDPV